MVSRGNSVVLGFVVLALILTYGGFWLTELPFEVLSGILVFVGIVCPMVVNNYLDSRETDGSGA